ncbi:hypothetical protein SPHINGO8AM_30331 [Sphingomonas sp. 8AM]|nr:hypothetical protein SPHINGO8AM_30331 [Sphingomonas sp. 8AM]
MDDDTPRQANETPARRAAAGAVVRGRAVSAAAARWSFRLFEHVLRVLRGRGQTHRVTLDVGDQPEGQVMMLRALPVLGGRRVVFGQLDTVAIDMVDDTDVYAVRTDHFGMFLDLAGIDHRRSPWLGSGGKRAAATLVA